MPFQTRITQGLHGSDAITCRGIPQRTGYIGELRGDTLAHEWMHNVPPLLIEIRLERCSLQIFEDAKI